MKKKIKNKRKIIYNYKNNKKNSGRLISFEEKMN